MNSRYFPFSFPVSGITNNQRNRVSPINNGNYANFGTTTTTAVTPQNIVSPVFIPVSRPNPVRMPNALNQPFYGHSQPRTAMQTSQWMNYQQRPGLTSNSLHNNVHNINPYQFPIIANHNNLNNIGLSSYHNDIQIPSIHQLQTNGFSINPVTTCNASNIINGGNNINNTMNSDLKNGK